MTLIGRFHPDPADPIADLVPLRLQGLEFRFRDRLGVAEGMGGQRPMRVEAKNVHIHLGTPQGLRLFAESQHLLRLEIQHQGGAIAITVEATIPSRIQLIGFQLKQIG